MTRALMILLLLTASAGATPRGGPAEAVAIARACVKRASAEPERARAWLSRVRRAAWWPELRLGAERDMGTRESIDPVDGSRYGTYALDELRLEVRLTWHLDRLVFDPEEARASREAVRLADLRQELALTAVRLYYERRRLQVESESDESASPRDAALRALRIEELGAALQALCGVGPSEEERTRAR